MPLISLKFGAPVPNAGGWVAGVDAHRRGLKHVDAETHWRVDSHLIAQTSPGMR